MSSNFPDPFHNTAPTQDSVHFDHYPEDYDPPVQNWHAALGLFLLTCITTTVAWLYFSMADIGLLNFFRLLAIRPFILLQGLSFSIPLIAILSAHELGHFVGCKYYGMRCTPPFFIPAPIPFTGTLGAFIKIKSRFKNKKALFDVGIAGPLAGFIVALPVLWIGIHSSKLIPKMPAQHFGISFGEPLLFRFIGMLALGYHPQTQDMLAHPMAMAGWVGLLVTSLNLLPIWQLDGGHIAYAIWGRRRHKQISVFALCALLLVSLSGWPRPPYLIFTLLLLFVGLRFKFYHPAPIIETEELGFGRKILAVAALLILVFSFTPVPFFIG